MFFIGVKMPDCFVPVWCCSSGPLSSVRVLACCELPAVVAFSLQAAPETFYMTIVAVEQWMGLCISYNSRLVKGFANKMVVVAFAQNTGHNVPVMKV